MYARISRARIKTGAREQVEHICAKFMAETSRSPGTTHWINFITDNDDLIVIGVYENPDDRAATASENERRWASGAHLLDGPPVVTLCRMTQFLHK